ncbi:hypothetical protein DIPPA_24888 [Diplonema papillatum]|nr:hypothetical protein DIPPA_24888 [Diplonema papillatum]
MNPPAAPAAVDWKEVAAGHLAAGRWVEKHDKKKGKAYFINAANKLDHCWNLAKHLQQQAEKGLPAPAPAHPTPSKDKRLSVTFATPPVTDTATAKPS